MDTVPQPKLAWAINDSINEYVEQNGGKPDYIILHSREYEQVSGEIGAGPKSGIKINGVELRHSPFVQTGRFYLALDPLRIHIFYGNRN